jgi:putative ABC transport system permease protein
MFRSHLRLAIRTLRRRLGYTAVNALGLTVGLGCCALVAVFLQYELSWDRHHENADRTYRLLVDYQSGTRMNVAFPNFRRSGPAEQRALAARLPEAVPAVEQASNLEMFDDPLYVRTLEGNTFTSNRQLFTSTGPAFADLFTFERTAGAPLEEALRAPGSAVLTQPVAQQYFGDQSPIGKTIIVDTLEATVQAVVADPPPNSQIQFDLALNVERIPYWSAKYYLRLAKGTDPSAVAPHVSAVMDEVDPSRLSEEDQVQRKGERLQAITNAHLGERVRFAPEPRRNPAYLWIFAAIGGLVLAITTINYANLALALYADRNAEIGIRKAVGGYRGQIAGQFLVEAALLTLACVPLALGACSAVLPTFNTLMNTEIAAVGLLQPAVVGAMVGLALLVGLIAGGYPAFVLARKKTVELFGRGLSAAGRQRWSLRHGLIALQFVVLIGLGSLSWIAVDQLRYMQDSDLGFQTTGVVRIASFQTDSLGTSEALQQRLRASPAIEAVGAGITPSPGGGGNVFKLAGTDRTYDDFGFAGVDVGWFGAMGIEHPVIDSMRAQGPSAPDRVLVNQAVVDRFGLDEPVGEEIVYDPLDYNDRYTIAGVLPNMHFGPMRQAIEPTVFRVSATRKYVYGSLVARLAPGQIGEGMAHIREVWSDFNPATPLETSFLSDQVTALYEQERQFTALTGALAVLAILMAALGLAALVAYLTRLRMKEIGIRKALGGSVASIVALLNKEYAWIVGAAFVIGAPLAWIAADWWLGQFAYQRGFSPLPFVVAGLGALAVAAGAVSTQALRTARIDPAKVLRSE